MNRKIFSILTIVAASFVLVLGAGVFNVAKADSDPCCGPFTLTIGDVNQVGDDEAVNSPKLLERDLDAGAPTLSQGIDNYDPTFNHE